MDYVFKLKQAVRWTVGGRGGSRQKSGVIFKTVAPGVVPEGFSKARPHKSYLVKDEDGKVFWPAVKSLVAA